MSEMKPKQPYICRACGKEFFPVRHERTYCSKECERKYRNDVRKDEKKTVTCIWCGKRFEVNYFSTVLYCEECKKAKKERRKKSAGRAVKKKTIIKPEEKEEMRPAELQGTKVMDYRVANWESGWLEVSETAQKKPQKARLKVDIKKMRKPMFEPTKEYRRDDKAQERRVSAFKLPPMNRVKSGGEFTKSDDITILTMMETGETFTTIGATLGKPPSSVKSRYHRLQKEAKME